MKFHCHGIQLELLPRAAYSVRDPRSVHSLGIALQRQQGVHAIGSDRRVDFDTWPGTLAYTPPGIDVFSESPGGGEYLLVRWTAGAAFDVEEGAGQRRQWSAHGPALRRALHLRRLLMAPERDELAIEQAMFGFMTLERGRSPAPERHLRPAYQRVLEQISAEFDQPLTIAQLAATAGRTPQAFLREFTRMVGMTPHAFIVETRLQAARVLIEREAAPLSLIAAECGFTHQSHMGVAFRKVLGQSPGAYRAGWRKR